MGGEPSAHLNYEEPKGYDYARLAGLDSISNCSAVFLVAWFPAYLFLRKIGTVLKWSQRKFFPATMLSSEALGKKARSEAHRALALVLHSSYLELHA